MPVTVTDDGDSEGGQTFEHFELVFAESIGVNLEEELAPELLQLVVKALYSLPSDEWEVKTTEYAQLDGLPFFFNAATQQSQWTHPYEEEIKQLLRERRSELARSKASKEETDKRLLTLALGMDIFFSPSPSEGSVQGGDAITTSSSPLTCTEENAFRDRIEEKHGLASPSHSQEYRSLASKSFVDALCGAALEKAISSAAPGAARANLSPDIDAPHTSASHTYSKAVTDAICGAALGNVVSSVTANEHEESQLDKKAVVDAILGAAVEKVAFSLRAEGALLSGKSMSPDEVASTPKQPLVIPRDLCAPTRTSPDEEVIEFIQSNESSIAKAFTVADDFFFVDPALLRRCVDHVDREDLADSDQRECIDIERLYHSRTMRGREESTHDVPARNESTKVVVVQTEEDDKPPSAGNDPQALKEMAHSSDCPSSSTDKDVQVNEQDATPLLSNESSPKALHNSTVDYEQVIIPNGEIDTETSGQLESVLDKKLSEIALSALRFPQTDEELRAKRLSVIAGSKSSIKIKFHEQRTRPASVKDKRRISSPKELREKSWVLLGAFAKYYEAVAAAKDFESSFPSRLVPACPVVGKSTHFSSKSTATLSAGSSSFSALSLNSPIHSRALQVSVKGNIPQLRIARDISRMQWLVECDADPRGHARTTFSDKIVTSKRTFSPLKTATVSGRAYSLPRGSNAHSDILSRSPDPAITAKASTTTMFHPVVAPKLSALKAPFSPQSMLSSSNSLHLSSQIPLVYKSSSVRSHSSQKSSASSLSQKRKSFNSGRLSMLPEQSFSTFGADFSGLHVTSTKRPSSPKTFRQALASLP